MADSSPRPSKPHPRRLKRRARKGSFPSAREFVSALQFLVFLALLGAGGADWFARFRSVTTRAVLRARILRRVRPEDLTAHRPAALLDRHFLPLVLGGLRMAAVTLLFSLVTTRFGLSLKKLAPDPARLNPLSKLQRTAAAESAVAAAGGDHAARLSVGRLRDRARQARGLPGAAAGERGERRRAHARRL